MVSRREKLSRSFFRTREQIFHKQATLIGDASLSQVEISAITEANHGPSIYDRLYSHSSAQDNSENFEKILARIEGVTSPELKNRQDMNGLIKSSDKPSNPYKRMYFNGATRRRGLFGSTSESETDLDKKNYSKRLGLHSADSSTDDEKKSAVRMKNKKAIERRKKIQDSKIVDTSSSDERWKSPRGRSLRQMERDMGDRTLSEDSDDLLPLPKSENIKKMNAIYSDSDSDTSLKDDKSSSSQHILKTKGELKAFTGIPKLDKDNKEKGKFSPKSEKSKSMSDGKYLRRNKKDVSNDDDENRDDKENIKSSRKGFDPSDLIVPQRQAAKKASENLRGFQGKKDDGSVLTDDLNKIDKAKEIERFDKGKNKIKSKSKLSREERAKSSDIFDFDHSDKDEGSDILAYVPQRQAAKKAAETIKCGMKVTEEAKPTEKKKDEVKKSMDRIKRGGVSGSKSPRSTKLSTSTTSSSSSSSSSTSSSSSESEDEPKKSIFDPDPKKKTNDWPFLDKESQSRSDDGKKFKKAPERKLKTSDGRPEIEFQPPSVEREESSRKRGVDDRVGNSSTRSGNSFLDSFSSPGDSERRKGKSVSDIEERLEGKTKSFSSSTKKSSKEIDLETEICQRRSTPRKPNKLDRLFESMKDKSSDESVKVKKDEQPLKRGPGRPKKNLTQTSLKKVEPTKSSLEVKDEKIKEICDKSCSSTEEKSPKVKPMPKSVKKALGLLEDSSSPEEEKKESEIFGKVKENIEKTGATVAGSDVSNKTYDKDKFRRSTRSMSGSDKSDVEHDLKSNSNISDNNISGSNNITNAINSDLHVNSKSELVLPNLVVGVDEKPVSPVDDTVRSSFSLDLALSEGGTGEPKKISSRTSSLGVPIYPHRSIFSPQTSNRDHLSDIFDFENDILAVDETVHEDPRPLQFNFNNEFLFKEDSKEDSKRETYNLVEKLRMEYAKKSTSHQDGSSPVTVSDEVPVAEVKDEKPVEVNKAPESVQSSEIIKDNVVDNQSPGYVKKFPDTPGFQIDEGASQLSHEHGKFTPKPHDAGTSAKTVESAAAYPNQKTPQTQHEIITPRYTDGPIQSMQDTSQSPAGYPPSRQGFEPQESYNFYGSCPPIQQDSSNVSVVNLSILLKFAEKKILSFNYQF